MNMQENSKNNANIDEWKRKIEKSHKKTKSLKGKLKKQKQKLKDQYALSYKQEIRAEKKIIKYKKRIKKEKERSKKLERKLTELKVQQQFLELNRRNDEKCFAMEQEITGLKHQIKHTTCISNLLLQEAVPNFVKKYGKVYAEPIDAEFTVVE